MRQQCVHSAQVDEDVCRPCADVVDGHCDGRATHDAMDSEQGGCEPSAEEGVPHASEAAVARLHATHGNAMQARPQLTEEEEAELAELMKPPDLAPGSSEPSNEIVSGLWLGDSTAARAASAEGGDEHSTRAILNAAHEGPPGHIDGTPGHDVDALLGRGLEYLELDIKDGSIEAEPLPAFLEAGADFIKRCLDDGKSPVLVHCSAGKSRSTCMVLGYLMKHRGMSLREAMVLTRSKRQRAYPMLKFWKQLLDWEASMGCPKSIPESALALHSEATAGKGGLQDAVSQLVALGFGEAAALAALQANGGDVTAAANALFS